MRKDDGRRGCFVDVWSLRFVFYGFFFLGHVMDWGRQDAHGIDIPFVLLQLQMRTRDDEMAGGWPFSWEKWRAAT